jgi:Tfp pilus assembly protein PilN
MIKINLLAEGKRPAAVRKIKAAALLEGKDIAPWLLAAGIVVALLASGIYWWILDSRIDEKQQEIAKAQKELDDLAQVIQEVEKYKADKAELERKIKVINDLKLNQRGPVRVMDDVSRSLPELLWLDRLEMEEASIVIEGRAFNTNAVANFMDNLEKVPLFGEVVPRDTQVQGGGVYKFVIEFPYSFTPRPETVPGEAAEGAAAPAPAPATGG